MGLPKITKKKTPYCPYLQKAIINDCFEGPYWRLMTTCRSTHQLSPYWYLTKSLLCELPGISDIVLWMNRVGEEFVHTTKEFSASFCRGLMYHLFTSGAGSISDVIRKIRFLAFESTSHRSSHRGMSPAGNWQNRSPTRIYPGRHVRCSGSAEEQGRIPPSCDEIRVSR